MAALRPTPPPPLTPLQGQHLSSSVPRGIASVWAPSSFSGLGSLGVGALSVGEEASATPKSAAGGSSVGR